LANIALKKGDLNTAIIQFEDALKIDPSMMDIRRQHVKLVKDNKDPDPSPDETISVNKPPYVDNSLIMSKLQYPELAKKAGLEGKVVLRVLVRRNGSVKKFIVENTDSELFNKSAGDAVMKTQFLPAIQNGKPVACWLSVPISFKIR
jgi:protein TonB